MPCVIVAGGPSLTLAQVRHVARARLANRCRVIAVNDAIYPCWWADWLHACDIKWWHWHQETALEFPGIRTTCTDTVPESWAHYLKVITPYDDDPRIKIADEPDTVASGNNGGYQAIQCAVKAGSRRVILLGFDMRFSDGYQSHWFGDHPDKMRSQYDNMLENFPGLKVALDARGVEVINCTPGSALTVFKKASLESVLGPS